MAELACVEQHAPSRPRIRALLYGLKRAARPALLEHGLDPQSVRKSCSKLWRSPASRVIASSFATPDACLSPRRTHARGRPQLEVGKTSLLRLLCGLLPPARRCAGKDAAGSAEDTWHQAVFFHGHLPAVHELLSPRENLRSLAAVQGLPPHDGAAIDALGELGLARQRDLPCGTLGGAAAAGGARAARSGTGAAGVDPRRAFHGARRRRSNCARAPHRKRGSTRQNRGARRIRTWNLLSCDTLEQGGCAAAQGGVMGAVFLAMLRQE